jgi:predicted Zn-dependent protease
MPRLPARDGGHTVFTDHRITARPKPDGKTTATNLAAWREPEAGLRDRNLALALVAFGFQNESPAEVVRGYRMLNRAVKDFPTDPGILTSLGSVLLRAKQPVEALRLFEKVLLLQPSSAPYEVNVATALIAAGREAEALPHLERAEQLDPLLEQAVELLTEVYTDEGEASKAGELMERYEREMGIGPVR